MMYAPCVVMYLCFEVAVKKDCDFSSPTAGSLAELLTR
jgi:hypothetical protein